jgi:L-aspartate oxidase
VGAVRYLPATSWSWSRETDVVIVGAGAAGMSAALDLARRGMRVIMVCKANLPSGSTYLAQGGLAAVTSEDDSFDAHVDDTLIAAAGLANDAAVRQLVAGAPDVVRYLRELGARFDAGQPGLEGGHSQRRIVHAGGDAIGAEMQRILSSALAFTDVEVLEHTVAVDALKNSQGDVVGIVAGQRRRDDANQLDGGVILAKAVVLATGGTGQAFASTTNPIDVTGDGLALAARAGAELRDLEFVQFHPTVLHTPGRTGPSSLLTEALRGAGAVIVDRNGTSVMQGRHHRGDLAPRDVVSFTMAERMASPSDPLTHLWLDARGIGESRLAREFPTARDLCRRNGFDLAFEPVPVAPGAHYSCGGVSADLDGATSLIGLHVIGESAATGVHGANRLASNSLTEAVLCGRRLARLLGDRLSRGDLEMSLEDVVAPTMGRGVDSHSRRSLAEMMSNHVGVIRDGDGLNEALDMMIQTPDSSVEDLDLRTLEATNLHTVSLLVNYAARQREESRGCHRRRDFPQSSEQQRQSITLAVVDGDVVERVVAGSGA